MTATQWLTRALAALVALALLLASLLVIVEVALAAAAQPPWLVDYTQATTWVQQHDWNDAMVKTILVAIVLLGLLLIFLSLRSGKKATLPLRQRTSGVDVKASRRSVESSLEAAASRTSGVTGADASIRRRNARIKARSAGRPESGLRQEVESAVGTRLDSLGLTRKLRLDVQVYAKDRR